MAKLYFMHREFEGLYLQWDSRIESEEFHLLFYDSWYWMHYCFFNCRDCISSEQSSAIRSNLYNTAALLMQNVEKLCGDEERVEHVFAVVAELLEISEYSKAFPICLWIFGDDTSKSFLDEWIQKLPPSLQIEALMQLPHFLRIERERLPYMSFCEEAALKRYRNEVAAYNKRNKQSHRSFKPAQDLTILLADKRKEIKPSTN